MNNNDNNDSNNDSNNNSDNSNDNNNNDIHSIDNNINNNNDNEEEKIEIFDGSLGEGGGQVIRSIMGYCYILKRSITINNIRSGRPKPGLAAQHLEGLLLIKQLSNGILENGYIGSTNITFIPSLSSSLLLDKYIANPNTAGSITLMIQISLPAITLSSNRNNNNKIILELHGGTNVSTSPSIDHFNHILLPLLYKYFDINIKLNLIQRGYYPKGGGLINIEVLLNNNNNNNINNNLELINRGTVKTINGTIFGNISLEKKIEIKNNITSILQTLLSKRTTLFDKFEDIIININIGSETSINNDNSNIDNNIDNDNNDNNNNIDNTKKIGVCFQWKKGQCNRGKSCKFAHSMNNNNNQNQNQNNNFKRKEKLTVGIFLCANTDTDCNLFSDILITDTNPIIDINKFVNTFIELLDSGACIDERTSDQLIIYMAMLIMNSSNNKILLSLLCEPINNSSSQHLETSINIAKHFTNGNFDIITREDKCRLIRCYK